MLVEYEQRKLNLCQPKTCIVRAKFTAGSSTFAGQAFLDRRLENIAAMRIKYFNCSLLSSATGDALNTIFLLRSTQLSALMNESDRFRVGASQNSTGQILTENSNIIGLVVRGDPSVSAISAASLLESNHSNNIQPFSSDRCFIDQFDWQIEPLSTSFTTPAGSDYEIMIVIEFFPICKCQKLLRNMYST